MPERMRCGRLAYPCLKNRLSYRFLHYPVEKMMPALDLRVSIKVSRRRRECPLPSPFSIGVGILPGQRKGQHDPARALAEIFLMQPVNAPQVRKQRFFHRFGQERDTILLPLAVKNGDLVSREVKVLESK